MHLPKHMFHTSICISFVAKNIHWGIVFNFLLGPQPPRFLCTRGVHVRPWRVRTDAYASLRLIWSLSRQILNSIPARIQKVLSEGVQLWHFLFFFVHEEKMIQYHYKRAINGPPAKRHLNGVSLACRWWPTIECWLCSFVNFQVIRTSVAKKPYIFVIFQGWSRPPFPPPFESAHVISWIEHSYIFMTFEARTLVL